MNGLLDKFWQELCDKDDRTSPAEHPDMCLITREELSLYFCGTIKGVAEGLKETAAMLKSDFDLKCVEPFDCPTGDSTLAYGRLQGLEIAAAIISSVLPEGTAPSSKGQADE
jgi:hypothetical protein